MYVRSKTRGTKFWRGNTFYYTRGSLYSHHFFPPSLRFDRCRSTCFVVPTKDNKLCLLLIFFRSRNSKATQQQLVKQYHNDDESSSINILPYGRDGNTQQHVPYDVIHFDPSTSRPMHPRWLGIQRNLEQQCRYPRKHSQL